jgi:N-acetylmuramoyl-L-alanine amidase
LTKIFIDLGHGGKDGGAGANGILEKDIVLKLGKKMQALLKNYQDIDVMLSRSEDVFLSLDARTDKANNWGADVLCSVHVNSAADASASGFESFRYPKANAGTVAFQNMMHEEIMKAIGGSNINDRGKKQENFHMLRESNMKALLTENLFISNSGNAAKLKDDHFLDQLAQGHVNGFEKFLGLKRIEKPPQTSPTKEKLYVVQVGAFEDKENAEALAADLTKEGYRPFIKYE